MIFLVPCFFFNTSLAFLAILACSGLPPYLLRCSITVRICIFLAYGFLILLTLALLLAFGIQKLSPALGGVAVGALILVYSLTAFWAFSNYYFWLDLFAPIATVGLGYLGIAVYNYIQEEKNKQFLKSSFGTYISPELIDEMYESGKEPELGGEEGYHTAFFTDIQSFSAFSEKLTASDLVSLLNDYLTAVSYTHLTLPTKRIV